MNREIPGYYFDGERNKYFKILPHHAGRGLAHSKDAINAKSAANEKAKREDCDRKRVRLQRLNRSQLLLHPELDFKRRIDGRSTGATTEVANFYCAALTRQKAFSFSGLTETFGPKFAIDEQTSDLFASFNGTRYLGRFRRPDPAAQCLWDVGRTSAEDVFPLPAQIDLLLLVPDTCLVYSESSTRELSTVVALGLGNFPTPGQSASHESHSNASIYSFAPGRRAWDMAASQYNPEWAVATDSGVDLYDGSRGVRLPGLGGLRSKEHMAVSFQDRHVVMAGSRTGRVRFGDIRGGNIDRLHHSSAVNAMRILKDSNKILVSGLQSMSVYDLRYTTKPAQQRKGKPMAFTTPLMSFNIPEDRRSDRYGLGFDFDPELGIVASASSMGYSHRISLYSVHTGKAIKQSPLNKSFEEPVTCIKMSHVRDGPKSLVLVSGRQMEEWTVSGTEKRKNRPGIGLFPFDDD